MARDTDGYGEQSDDQRGGDRAGLRAYNERLILSVIRQRGPLSKAELARVTGLSAQGVSIIVSGLLKEKLVRKESKVRGNVGQPYTPIALHPRGRFSVGIKIGRRNLEVVLLDFVGTVIAHERMDYAGPYRQQVIASAQDALSRTLDTLSAEERQRTIGIGIAMPGDMHAWASELGLEPGALDDWQGADPADELQAATGLPTFPYNDITASCAAEMYFGEAITARSVVYLFVGGFIGGGIVLDGRLHTGSRGNAGALGSMPMDSANGTEGPPDQLIHRASLIFLQRDLNAAGLDGPGLIAGRVDDLRGEEIFQAWCARAGAAIARTVVCAASVFDFEQAVIDGVMRADWQDRLVHKVRHTLTDLNLSGLSPITIETGSVGEQAPALGAALMPLTLRFTPHADLLVKQTPTTETLSSAGADDSVGNRLVQSES
ncbi:ROK family transcriptional regulator [Rhodovibrio salinarum]|uniref:ROK family transcriptional regulator n=1 Tax=Rhodovibrio salinarum TaxID=1087 RepID=A0A934QI94_9PROT|nr:ROK family transcriptional regulator [Rhodovibrio salinarum]MBK1697202.1 ROK family transcriptional regulator [Rhodovibrio salinarum]